MALKAYFSIRCEVGLLPLIFAAQSSAVLSSSACGTAALTVPIWCPSSAS
jgi:hypothetical protein